MAGKPAPAKVPSPEQTIATAKKNLRDTDLRPKRAPRVAKARAPKAKNPGTPQDTNLRQQYQNMSKGALW